jgi:hypothetical protein
MFRSLRSPLLRVRPPTTALTLRRGLSVTSAETPGHPAAASFPGMSGPMASLLESEPKGPHVLTDLPGPKVRAAKDAMGKIQDVRWT